MMLPLVSSKSLDDSLSFRNFQEVPLPIQRPGAQGLPHPDPAYFQTFLFSKAF